MEYNTIKKWAENVLINTQAYDTIMNDIKLGQLSHCYLLNCVDKLTRQMFAILFAKKVICNCNNINCNICNKIEKMVHPDVKFFLNESEVLKVEDAKNILISTQYFGMEQAKKIYILDNFEFATPQMQNKMLKLLEDPPENVHFLLMAGHIDNVISPVKSRSKKININSIEENILDEILTELKIDKNTQDIAKFIGQNYLGKTIETIENKNILQIYKLCIDFFENCKSSKNALNYTSQISGLKNSFDIFLSIYALILSEICYNRYTHNYKNTCIKNTINAIKDDYDLASLIKIANEINKYNKEYLSSCNLNIIVDKIVFDNLEARLKRNSNGNK